MAVSPKHAKSDPKVFYGAKDQDELIDRYDQAADVYDAAMEGDVGWTGHLELAKVVERHVDKAARICDAGAGTGMLGAKLAAAGFTNMDANDLSPGMLDSAQAKGVYNDCRVMELGKTLPYDNDSYDAVTACGVFTPNHAPASSLGRTYPHHQTRRLNPLHPARRRRTAGLRRQAPGTPGRRSGGTGRRRRPLPVDPVGAAHPPSLLGVAGFVTSGLLPTSRQQPI